MSLDFAVWAPDEETFWQSWLDAGIATNALDGNGVPIPGKYVATPDYPGIMISSQSDQGWMPTRKTGNIIQDEFGNEIEEREPVPGWHANVRVTDPGLIAEMTYGIDPIDEGGNLKNVFDRTWATLIFQLEWREADPTTGFPAGYRNTTGVCYCDPTDFKSPTNVWL